MRSFAVASGRSRPRLGRRLVLPLAAAMLFAAAACGSSSSSSATSGATGGVVLSGDGLGGVAEHQPRRRRKGHLGNGLRGHRRTGRGSDGGRRAQRHRAATRLGELRRDHRCLSGEVPGHRDRFAAAERILGGGDHRRPEQQGHRQGSRRVRPRAFGGAGQRRHVRSVQGRRFREDPSG